VVVSSTNDPYGSVDHARAYATAWGSELVEVGAQGHLNADSNLGNWREGFRLLEKMNNG
jgi:predicted alpha/beta hydrolase family esterase